MGKSCDLTYNSVVNTCSNQILSHTCNSFGGYKYFPVTLLCDYSIPHKYNSIFFCYNKSDKDVYHSLFRRGFNPGG